MYIELKTSPITIEISTAALGTPNPVIELHVPGGGADGDMKKTVYDTNLSGIVDKAESINDGTNSATAADIKDAVNKKHTQGTDTALGAVGTKNPPIDADKALYRNSTASDALVTSTWTQVKAFLKTYFDGIYSTYTNLTSFVDQTAWRVFYSNTAGDVTELALGADGTYLKSNGATAAPTFSSPAGGDVTGPATNNDEYIPQWNGADSKTLKNGFAKSTLALSGANSDITSMTGITGAISTPTNLASKTTGTLSKSIGATGDYATFFPAIAACPDLIAHAATYTIQAGTTLTETCTIKNKHGVTSAGSITVQAEKYFPESGVIPTADSASGTTLVDAALATAAKGDDYFNGCWIFVVDGTGTDNGFVPITDYTDASGTVIVASWPGTQPDNTSRYIIVGAMLDAVGSNYGMDLEYNTVPITVKGIGVKTSNHGGFRSVTNVSIGYRYCGAYGNVREGISGEGDLSCTYRYGGIVGNNTGSHAYYGGARSLKGLYFSVAYCGVSDNNIYGIFLGKGQYGVMGFNFGDLNGTWGTFVNTSAQCQTWGSECSGTSGNHSNSAGQGALVYY